jgi:hypothetical protein
MEHISVETIAALLQWWTTGSRAQVAQGAWTLGDRLLALNNGATLAEVCQHGFSAPIDARRGAYSRMGAHWAQSFARSPQHPEGRRHWRPGVLGAIAADPLAAAQSLKDCDGALVWLQATTR